MNPRNELGRRLRSLREERGLSIKEAAARAGLTRDGLSKIERGQNDTRVSTLLEICRALDVDFGEMLAGLGK